MKVLVTGGTGVVGHASVTALIAHGHTVRLLSRHAERDARRWPARVEPFPGDVGRPDTLRGAADGCDAVLHVVGIVSESPPDITFERVNVDGTRQMLAETERAKVGKFIYVSSLGAERGSSPYHRSKLRAEQLVQRFHGGWVILRPGNVYGPGDDEISLLLKMIRSLPAVPVIGDGEQRFQPVWHEDLGEALARAVERHDLHGRVLELAGPETTSQNELIERFRTLTDRDPVRLPLPGFLSEIGAKLVSSLHFELPFNESQLAMLREQNVIDDPAHNALTTVFRIEPTRLDEGLRRLVDEQPELLPERGVGALERKRFWAHIHGTSHTPESFFALVRREFPRVFPLPTDAEPGSPRTPDYAVTLTMELPVRGHVQVRVGDVDERQLTLLTLEGHPLAGAVRMLVEARGDALRFEVQIFDRSSNTIDFVVMSTFGALLQNANWVQVVENAVELSGGRAPEGVEHDIEKLDDEQADRIEAWLEDLALRLRRRETEARTGDRSGLRETKRDAPRGGGDSTELRP